MSENISMTRIIDLPDSGSFERGTSFEQNSLGADMYIPINGHPNPYGIPPPPAGGMSIPQPQQIQNAESQYKNTMIQQRLPQRDIPMNISEHMQDEQIQPNYIPKPKLTSDYIHEYEENHYHKIKEHEAKKMREKKAVYWFDEFQNPIIIFLLYFIFQLPIINTMIFKKFTFLSIYREDGNFNLVGLILKSVLFASSFYSLHKSIDIISQF
jgi:hypothetical protein